MDLLPQMMDLQAENTELNHKVRIAIQYLEKAQALAKDSGFVLVLGNSYIELALIVLKKKGETRERRVHSDKHDKRVGGSAGGDEPKGSDHGLAEAPRMS